MQLLNKRAMSHLVLDNSSLKEHLVRKILMLLLMYFRFSVVLKTKYLSKNLIATKLNLSKIENRAVNMYFNKF